MPRVHRGSSCLRPAAPAGSLGARTCTTTALGAPPPGRGFRPPRAWPTWRGRARQLCTSSWLLDQLPGRLGRIHGLRRAFRSGRMVAPPLGPTKDGRQLPQRRVHERPGERQGELPAWKKRHVSGSKSFALTIAKAPALLLLRGSHHTPLWLGVGDPDAGGRGTPIVRTVIVRIGRSHSKGRGRWNPASARGTTDTVDIQQRIPKNEQDTYH
jgi:hypothetical protein